ncbi:hypothetical protein [Streptomyces sp. NPDC058954]|uniref:hypothetical protein n=1 Tax=Streptomyces sp. NPDC058954 TaxID=3346677 RepID=UPI0036C4F12D
MTERLLAFKDTPRAGRSVAAAGHLQPYVDKVLSCIGAGRDGAVNCSTAAGGSG